MNIEITMQRLMRTAVLVSAVILSACVSTPKSRPFNAAQHADMQQIEALAMRHSEPTVLIVNNPAMSFGVIGVLAAEAHMASRRSWLEKQITATGFDHVETFTRALDQAMLTHGYTLIWPAGVAETPKARTARTAWGNRKQYAAASDPASAGLLDVNFGFIGFASAGSSDSSPYRPTVVVSARLLDAEGKQELFYETVVYNDVFPGIGQGLMLSPDPEHNYPDFDALKSADAAAIDALKIAFERTAIHLADQLRRVQ